ncbi:ABC transporter ATP-binding protein/permease [Amylibacter sp.]|nr:ABC transporter ATP-binding protein/permease [Amylibacter sp.]
MFRNLEESVTDNSARMLSNVIQEVTRLRDMVMMPFMNLLAKLSVASMLILAFLIYDFSVAIAAAGFLVLLYFLIYRTIRSTLSTTGEYITQKNQIVISRISDAFLALRELHIRNGRERAVEELSINLVDLGMMRGKLNVIAQVPRYFVEFMALGSIGVFSIYFSLTQPVGSPEIFSVMAVYALAGFKILPAIQHIFGNVVQIRSNIQSFDAIHTDLKMERDLIAQLNSLNKNIMTKSLPFEKSIQLKGVSYWFENQDRKVIKNVNLQIDRGQTIAIVGASGSGKSTLLDLIVGIRQPKIGTLCVDGVEINNKNLSSWFANVSLMPQQSFLLDSTIRENIAFGSDEGIINNERINSTINQVGLSSVISKSPDGIFSRIGERGGLFSGGERQRIGIARVLYQDAPVIFIDEATSALDQKSETEIFQCLDVLHDKTIVFITHQLSTIRKCDKIIVVDDGEVIGVGCYDDLIKTNLKFQAMTNR